MFRKTISIRKTIHTNCLCSPQNSTNDVGQDLPILHQSVCKIVWKRLKIITNKLLWDQDKTTCYDFCREMQECCEDEFTDHMILTGAYCNL